MKYPRYPAYKESGVEWIGEIPVTWNIKKLKYIIGNFIGGGTPSTSVSDFWTTEGGFPWVAISDITRADMIWDTERKITVSGLNSKNLTLLSPGTIVYSMYASVGKVSKLLINAATNQAILGMVNKENQVLNDYLKLSLESFEPFVGLLFSSSTQNNINEEKVKNIIIPLTNIVDQASIIRFLSTKNALIDNLISKTQKMIELLKEKRKAIIISAVTKGFDSSVPMKDSSVEWIGEIPKHWIVMKIKHTSYVKGRVGWKGLTTEEYLENGYAYLVTGLDFQSKTIFWDSCYYVDKRRYDDDPYIQLKNGDLLITKDGTIGKLAIVDGLEKPACLNSGIFLVRPYDYYRTDFLYYVLSSTVFSNFYFLRSFGSTIQHLYQNVFEDFSFPIPPIEEQGKIVDYLERQTGKIDKIIFKEEKMVQLLNEYKKSLISQAVTGKIDVRGFAYSSTSNNA
jgi:type I restriction enzyme S subunit